MNGHCQQMCEVENVVLGTPGYERVCRTALASGPNCSALTESVVSLFYGAAGGVRSCELLAAADVAATAATLYGYGSSSNPLVAGRYGYYLSKDTYGHTPPATQATRTTLYRRWRDTRLAEEARHSVTPILTGLPEKTSEVDAPSE